MRPVRLTKAMTLAASANNIGLSQTPGAAGNLTLNGTTVVGGVAILDTPRRVLLTLAGSEVGKTFVVYGNSRVNGTGNDIQESLAGTAPGTISTTLDFGRVTRISISAAAAGAITVGISGIGSTEWQAVDTYLDPMNLTVSVDITGTINYTMQYTYDNIMGEYNPAGGSWANTYPTKIWDDSVLANLTADGETTLTKAITAWRITINSSTAPASLVATGIQSGVGGFAS